MKSKTQPKIMPSNLRAEADRLIATGQMPDLATLLGVVATVREERRPEILEVQRRSRIHVVVSARSHQNPSDRTGRDDDTTIG